MNSFQKIIITLLILIFVFIIPGICFIYFYFKKFEVFFIPAFIGLFITFGIYTFIWKNEENKEKGISYVLCNHPYNNYFQLILSIISSINYIYYIYNVDYIKEQDKSYQYIFDYEDKILFVEIEYFLTLCFSFDLSLNIYNSFRNYNIIDIIFFIAMCSFIFIQNFLNIPYNIYLLQGCLRFLKIYRTIKTIENNTYPIFILTSKILTVIFTMSSLINFFEFPCETETPSYVICHDELKQFHNCVYFIIVTLSTVGYGDVVPVTFFGRICVICIISVGLIMVPIQINNIINFLQQKNRDDISSTLEIILKKINIIELKLENFSRHDSQVDTSRNDINERKNSISN
jgi:hypothetical protein